MIRIEDTQRYTCQLGPIAQRCGLYEATIESFCDTETGLNVRPNQNNTLSLVAKRNDRFGFTTWVITIKRNRKIAFRMGVTPQFLSAVSDKRPTLAENADTLHQCVNFVFNTYVHVASRGELKAILLYENPQLLWEEKVRAYSTPRYAHLLDAPLGDSTPLEQIATIMRETADALSNTPRSRNTKKRATLLSAGCALGIDGSLLRIFNPLTPTSNAHLGIYQYGHVVRAPILAVGCPNAKASVFAFAKEGYGRRMISTLTGIPLSTISDFLR